MGSVSCYGRYRDNELPLTKTVGEPFIVKYVQSECTELLVQTLLNPELQTKVNSVLTAISDCVN